MAKKPRKPRFNIGKKAKRRLASASELAPISKAKDFIKGGDTADGTEKSPVRITNDTVAQYREEVLSGARRFIYPLAHSKHRIAIISGFIITFIVLVIGLYSWFLLYRQQSTSDFAYRISQIIPFPIVRVEGDFIRYEEYLFELKHNIHYLANQERVDFESEEGRDQLEGLKQQALLKVIERYQIRKLADEYGVSVTSQEVSEQIDLIRSQSGVGDESQTLEDTLEDFWGWDVGDLRRVIRAQILKQKLVPLLDTGTRPQAQSVLDQIMAGEISFADASAQYSEDEFTKNERGEFGFIFRSNTEIPPQLVEKAFSLAEGEVSNELVETLFGLHIVRTLQYRSDNEALVAHILFRYDDINLQLEQDRGNLNIVRYVPIQIEDETLDVETPVQENI